MERSNLQNRSISFITQENSGSAGGWYSGIKYALDHDFDAIWLMDDDGFPDDDALSLLDAALLPNVVCASSVVVREDLSAEFVFPLPVLNVSGLPIIWGRKRKIITIDELRAVAPEGPIHLHIFLMVRSFQLMLFEKLAM